MISSNYNIYRIFFGLAIFLSFHISHAQSFKFGDVSEEELIETYNGKFPDANATILYRKQFVYFENTLNNKTIQKTEIFERIKIYNRKGFDQAAKFISFYNDEKIRDLQAFTYNLVDNEISRSSFKKDSIVEIVNNSRINTSKYILPDLNEGCVIEFKYILETDCCFASNIPLQMDVPIKKLDVRLRIPDSLNFATIFNPNSSITPKVERSKRVRDESTLSVGPRQSGVSENMIIITHEDIPGIKDEPFSNIESYRAKLSLLPEQLELDEEIVLDASWDEIAGTINNTSGYNSSSELYDLFEDDLKTVLNGTENDIEKAAILYNYIKLKMKWNGLEGYVPNLGISKSYSSGIGNTADINLTLLSLLRYTGLKAYPVLINTLNNGFPQTPSKNAFNYIICAVKINNSYTFFDASDNFTSPNVLPLKVLTNKGLLIKEEGTSQWIDLVPKKPSTKKVSVNIRLNSDLTMTGNVKSQYSDYQAENYRNQIHTLSERELINGIKKDNIGLKIYNFKSKSESDLENTINQSYDFIGNGEIRKKGNKLYFSPLIFLETKGNPFNEDTRNYPIDFKFPIENEYQINVAIPQGYVVEYLPKNDIIHFNDNDGEFTYLTRKVGNMLQFIMTLKLNKTLVLPEEYQKIKEFYQRVMDKKNEELILKEVNYESRRRSKSSR